MTEAENKALEANSVLDSPVFKEAHFELRKSYFQELLAAPVYDLTAQRAHAKLLALEDVVSQLKAFVTDAQMQARRK